MSNLCGTQLSLMAVAVASALGASATGAQQASTSLSPAGLAEITKLEAAIEKLYALIQGAS